MIINRSTSLALLSDYRPVSMFPSPQSVEQGVGTRPVLNSVAILGNFLPRRCGIATFTSDLRAAMREQLVDADCWVIAMNDKPGGYDYPSPVRYQIDENQAQQYAAAAEELNRSGADAVCIQHEFGIFGGEFGCHLLRFMEKIQIPSVVTLHTVLNNPPPGQIRILQRIARLTDRLVVMGAEAARSLSVDYAIPEEKIVHIPHGIPDLEFVRPENCRYQSGMAGSRVILTFGLLSPGKGLEYMIDAMPEIVRTHPSAQYIILGRTHPHVQAEEGETYRNALHRRAESLGVENHVRFVDDFLDKAELLDFIRIADVVVTPYLNEAQVTSGVLSYALGMGRAVVSTPYWHASEALADDRGVLVPFEDKNTMAERISFLLHNDRFRQKLQFNAYQYSRGMIWSEVARRYLETIGNICDSIREPRMAKRYSQKG